MGRNCGFWRGSLYVSASLHTTIPGPRPHLARHPAECPRKGRSAPGGTGCREVVLIQPEKRSKKKTDPRDANELSQTLWVNRLRLLGGKRIHGLKRIVPPSKEEENRQLAALRKRMSSLRTRTINQVQHILLKHNLQQECPAKKIQTKKARRWLAELSLDEIDRFPRPGSLANYWGITPGCRNSGDATDRLQEASLKETVTTTRKKDFLPTAINPKPQEKALPEGLRRAYARKRARMPLTQKALSGKNDHGLRSANVRNHSRR